MKYKGVCHIGSNAWMSHSLRTKWTCVSKILKLQGGTPAGHNSPCFFSHIHLEVITPANSMAFIIHCFSLLMQSKIVCKFIIHIRTLYFVRLRLTKRNPVIQSSSVSRNTKRIYYPFPYFLEYMAYGLLEWWSFILNMVSNNEVKVFVSNMWAKCSV